MKKNGIILKFNTDSRISSCARAHCLRYVKGNHQSHRIAFPDFLNIVLVRKITFLQNLRSISFIGNRSLFFSTIPDPEHHMEKRQNKKL